MAWASGKPSDTLQHPKSLRLGRIHSIFMHARLCGEIQLLELNGKEAIMSPFKRAPAIAPRYRPVRTGVELPAYRVFIAR